MAKPQDGSHPDPLVTAWEESQPVTSLMNCQVTKKYNSTLCLAPTCGSLIILASGIALTNTGSKKGSFLFGI